jgi:hypothetical protein
LPYTLEGRELATGYRLFHETFDAPSPGDIVFHPPGLLGDGDPPLPVGGSPVRFFLIAPSSPGTRDLAPGLSYTFEPGQLSVSGDLGPAHGDVEVRLLGLEDFVDEVLRTDVGGTVSFSVAASAGRRYLLAIGAEVGVHEPLTILFNEGMAQDLGGIGVLDSAGRSAGVEIAFVGSADAGRITPVAGWRAGETYTLRLDQSLADAAGTPRGKNH